jgi:hypothetical protein
MKDDRSHAQQLLRDLAIINARTERELGPLPPGGLPIVPKRKPVLPERKLVPTAPVHADNTPQNDENEDMDLTRIAATAALTAMAALSACAADQPTHATAPTSQRQPTHIGDAVVALPPDAAAQASPLPARHADAEEPEPEYGPPIPAAELQKRILALMASFRSLEDLERAHVERMTETTMLKRPTMSDGYQVFGKTTEDWVYRIGVSRLARMDEPPTILIDLDNGVAPWADQQPTYCTLDFEEVAKELVAIGYEQGARPRAAGGAWMWGFGRDSVDKKTSFGVGVVVYEWPLLNGSKQVCIKGFDIGGGINND